MKHPSSLKQTAYDRLKESWEKRHMGLENSHKVAILEEGMDVARLAVSPEEAQFLESRKYQTNEIARMFRVPPHMLADLERATFSNIEHMGIEFVVYSLQPWIVMYEQSIFKDLLLPAERKEIYAKFQVMGLLRGDMKSRYEAYHQARQDGWMNGDEIRELEDMNPMERGQGKIYLVPLNMVPADSVTEAGAQAGERGVRAIRIPANGQVEAARQGGSSQPAGIDERL